MSLFILLSNIGPTSIQKDVEKIVSKDAKLRSQLNFDRIVFKDKLEKYHNFVRS